MADAVLIKLTPGEIALLMLATKRFIADSPNPKASDARKAAYEASATVARSALAKLGRAHDDALEV